MSDFIEMWEKYSRLNSNIPVIYTGWDVRLEYFPHSYKVIHFISFFADESLNARKFELNLKVTPL